MRRISTTRQPAWQEAAAAKHSRPHRDYQLAPAFPRFLVGITAALAGLSAALLVFGPFSDLSAIQLASGPRSSVLRQDGTPIVLARTGRSWATEERRTVAASDEPVTRVARATLDAANRSKATR